MSQYKFTYLDVIVLGEINRYLFAYGGIEYQDIRIPIEHFVNKDQYFQTLKKEFPFGLLPTLEIDGKVIAQSLAIARYLATKVGLYGKDSWENLLIDEAVGHIDDFRIKVVYSYLETDVDVKIIKIDDVKKIHIPYYIQRFDEIISKNGGYFVLGRITLADLFFHSLMNYLRHFTDLDLVQGYKNLERLANEVQEIPAIKEWLQIRPKRNF